MSKDPPVQISLELLSWLTRLWPPPPGFRDRQPFPRTWLDLKLALKIFQHLGKLPFLFPFFPFINFQFYSNLVPWQVLKPLHTLLTRGRSLRTLPNVGTTPFPAEIWPIFWGLLWISSQEKFLLPTSVEFAFDIYIYHRICHMQTCFTNLFIPYLYTWMLHFHESRDCA